MRRLIGIVAAFVVLLAATGHAQLSQPGDDFPQPSGGQPEGASGSYSAVVFDENGGVQPQGVLTLIFEIPMSEAPRLTAGPGLGPSRGRITGSLEGEELTFGEWERYERGIFVVNFGITKNGNEHTWFLGLLTGFVTDVTVIRGHLLRDMPDDRTNRLFQARPRSQ